MRVRWFGQSAFRLEGAAGSVMHFRTPLPDFLDTLDPFLAAVDGEVVQVGASETEIDGAGDSRRVLVLRPPEV
jgi:hypothetical protein